MMTDGRHELAAARCCAGRRPDSPTATRCARPAASRYLKLMEKYQEFNPFKFILYAAQIDQSTAQIEGRAAQAGSGR